MGCKGRAYACTITRTGTHAAWLVPMHTLRGSGEVGYAPELDAGCHLHELADPHWQLHLNVLHRLQLLLQAACRAGARACRTSGLAGAHTVLLTPGERLGKHAAVQVRCVDS